MSIFLDYANVLFFIKTPAPQPTSFSLHCQLLSESTSTMMIAKLQFSIFISFFLVLFWAFYCKEKLSIQALLNNLFTFIYISMNSWIFIFANVLQSVVIIYFDTLIVPYLASKEPALITSWHVYNIL